MGCEHWFEGRGRIQDCVRALPFAMFGLAVYSFVAHCLANM